MSAENHTAFLSRAERLFRPRLRTVFLSLCRDILVLCIFTSCRTSDVKSGAALAYRGADISYYYQQEQCGVRFFRDGAETPLFAVLKDAGVNWIRLRLWHTPEDGWNGLSQTVSMAKRIKAAGFSFLLDIHYSDRWADPSAQDVPAEWSGFDFSGLQNAVKAYTELVLETFSAAGCAPDMVQTGNEIVNGMLFPYGRIRDNGNCDDCMSLLVCAVEAVRLKCPPAKVMLHIPCDSEIARAVWWYSQAEAHGVDYDVIGLSFYSFFTGADFDIVSDTVHALSTFGREICIVETAYPWTLGWNDSENNLVGREAQLIPGFSAAKDGQQQYLDELCRRTVTAGGSGVFWWEPQAVSAETFPSALENLSWFDFDNEYLGTHF